MTKPIGRPRNRPNLTMAEREAIATWYQNVRKLGKRSEYLRQAALEWQAKKRALGTARELAAKMGVCEGTIHTAAFRKHVT